MSDLPKDLIEEILCRVPATSLKKLRYTCKQWNSLFNMKRFTRKHSDKAPKQFLVLMLKQYRVCLMSVNLIGVPSVQVVVDPLSNLDQFKISNISQCDGLLLFTQGYTKIVVWNPCTGQSRWMPTPINRSVSYTYALGSYQCNKSGDNSYKILCHHRDSFRRDKFQIYEIKSDSWRSLEVNLDCIFKFYISSVSLKGKSYWFAIDNKKLSIFLLSFDYTTEIFERLLLPCQNPIYETMSLSIVREEKLSVLLQNTSASKTDIWVTNKIDETKLVSWSKILTVNLKPKLDYWENVSFLVDEEKKVLVCSCMNYSAYRKFKYMVYIVGEDNKVSREDFGFGTSRPFLFNYVPSLTQIHKGRGKSNKRKRNQV